MLNKSTDIVSPSEKDTEEVTVISKKPKLHYKHLSGDGDSNLLDVNENQLEEENPENVLFEVLFSLRKASIEKEAVQSEIQQHLLNDAVYQALLIRDNDHRKNYSHLKEYAQTLIEKVVADQPEIKPSDIKKSHGVSYKQVRDYIYVGDISAQKGKGIVHDWLLTHGYWKGENFYLNINGQEIQSPIQPVLTVTPTLPSDL